MMKVICFGEVLWDLLPSGKVAGGAPMNVAVHLRNMGINTTVISRVGNDDLGNKLIDFVKRKGVEVKFLQIDENRETGVVNVDVSNPTDVKYDIAMPSAWDYISCGAPVLDAVRAVDAFVYGSLASRTAVSRAAVLELLAVAKYRVFDVNLRLPHFEKKT